MENADPGTGVMDDLNLPRVSDMDRKRGSVLSEEDSLTVSLGAEHAPGSYAEEVCCHMSLRRMPLAIAHRRPCSLDSFFVAATW